jgi:hypothetical protein
MRRLTNICALFGAIGLLSHILFFMHGHRDQQALRIIIGHILAFTASYALSASKIGIWSGILASSAAIASYLVALFTSIVVYRVFFHRLSRFPGPLGAKITRFYGTFLAQSGPVHLEQNKVLEEYGDIVRIGASLISLLPVVLCWRHPSNPDCSP